MTRFATAMTLIDVADLLRSKLRAAPGFRMRPRGFACALRLDLVPIPGARSTVIVTKAEGRLLSAAPDAGDDVDGELHFDDNEPDATKDYLIARAAAAYALRELGFIRAYSPHDFALELCRLDGSIRRRVVTMVKVRPLKRGDAMGA